MQNIFFHRGFLQGWPRQMIRDIWPFAQTPLETPQLPKAPKSQIPNVPGSPIELLLSAKQNSTEFHCIALSFPEFPPAPAKFAQIPQIFWKPGVERLSQSASKISTIGKSTGTQNESDKETNLLLS